MDTKDNSLNFKDLLTTKQAEIASQAVADMFKAGYGPEWVKPAVKAMLDHFAEINRRIRPGSTFG